MVSEKYVDDFISYGNYSKTYQTVLNALIRRSKILKIDLTDWTDIELDNYLKSISSISNRYIANIIRIYNNFRKFVASKENMNFEISTLKSTDYLPFKKKSYVIKTHLLTYNQYQDLISQLKLNVRDRLIPELVWNGIEISNLSEILVSNILFIQDYVMIQIELNKYTIKDIKTISDIKQCMNTFKYTTIGKNKAPHVYSLISSKYLLKVADVGIPSDGKLGGVGTKFKQALKAENVKIEDYPMDKLTLRTVYISGREYRRHQV